MDPGRVRTLPLLLGAWSWALMGTLAARTGPVRGVTAWPGLLGGVVANVHVSHPGRSGHHSPTAKQADAAAADLTTAAQTYAQYDHFDARAPHQPVSVYQEFRLQQHHPPSAQYTTPPDTVADTTTFAPTYYSEQTGAAPPAPPQPALHTYAPHAAQEPTPAASSPRPAAKSLGHHESTLHHELQMQLSQQIQVQLEQLQKLHELQHKMLKVPKETAQPAAQPQAVQQSSEHVNRHVPPPNLVQQHHQHQPAAQQGSEHVPRHVPHPEQSHHHHQQQPVTAASPVVYAPIATPSPPPLTEPRYPEESQPLHSFIGETTSAPIGGAISNGFQPILPPAGRQPDAQHPGADVDTEFQPSFQPFTEDATDPALPFYLLPPAEDSDSQFNSLRETAVDAPAAELGDPDINDTSESTASSELDAVQAYRHPVRGRHRLRPPR
ncbi:uncharacterized protein LOC113218142 [Frankliniella occidentalis]|uniref:Uncharacterized protein LOC113218142 n=1 Tax=Frankliniella occidentalis TaxID=133901 RepID=A0A9C6XR14_FRAOC|nr:uncharacterized protein LOC113218142 [Frankliniella occidentalis]